MNMSCPLDPFPTSILIDSDVWLDWLVHIVNMSLSTGIMTEPLKTAIVKPLLTLSDPGYFRGGGFKKKAPPYDLENCCVNLHHIIHVNFTRCFRHDPIEIFQKFAILTILQQFQNKK